MPARTSLRSGELARSFGISRDTLRYYERMGLLPPPLRSHAGYRLYSDAAQERLRVIRGALAIGFSVEELARIFKRRDQNQAPCEHVRELALAKAEQLQSRIAELSSLRRELLRATARWEKLLARAPAGGLAHLLEDFVTQNPKMMERISPLIAPGLKQSLAARRRDRK